MNTIELQVTLSDEQIEKLVEAKIKEAVVGIEKTWFVDIEDLSTFMNMSKRFLETEVVNDERMKAIEIKKSRKRWWPTRKAYEIVCEILSEWKNEN